ncbi:MAG: PD-(D/E)XK nuclease family protein, partial [Nanoarchaeota archaeon]
ALYSIAIKELFGQDKNVLLIWHYLAHNMKIISQRTNKQLEKLKQQIIQLIDKIESTTEFPPNKTILCNWCEYKSICPLFAHQRKLCEFQNKNNLNQENSQTKENCNLNNSNQEQELEIKDKYQKEKEIQREKIKEKILDIW